ncbi:hypothetical protein SNEBB_003702 [Seison nebaliae]|nr:hypothetical protein SNEBB_003702 [Seison nebaliae]
MSLINCNFDNTLQKEMNEQINREFYASYVYRAMAFNFDRQEYYAPGHVKMFKERANEEIEHAETLMHYMNKRGGLVQLQPIRQPDKNEWLNFGDALFDALLLEKNVYIELKVLAQLAEEKRDLHMTDFLTTQYLTEQIDDIRLLGNMLTQLERAETNIGTHLFDLQFLKDEKKNEEKSQ